MSESGPGKAGESSHLIATTFQFAFHFHSISVIFHIAFPFASPLHLSPLYISIFIPHFISTLNWLHVTDMLLLLFICIFISFSWLSLPRRDCDLRSSARSAGQQILLRLSSEEPDLGFLHLRRLSLHRLLSRASIARSASHFRQVHSTRWQLVLAPAQRDAGW